MQREALLRRCGTVPGSVFVTVPGLQRITACCAAPGTRFPRPQRREHDPTLPRSMSWRRAMTLNTSSFFAGIAATVGILVLGFGGGVMVSGMLSGDPRPPNKIERQAREASPKEQKDTKPVI